MYTVARSSSLEVSRAPRLMLARDIASFSLSISLYLNLLISLFAIGIKEKR